MLDFSKIHWSYIILSIPLLIAIYTDLRKNKIYNWLTIPTLLLGLIFAFVKGGYWGLLDGFVGFFFAFLIGFVLYIPKALKGGDVKLISAIGAWVGYTMILNTILWIFLCGGAVSIFYIIIRGTFFKTMQKVIIFFLPFVVKGMKPIYEVTDPTNQYVPYGIAISIGTFLSLLYPDLLVNFNQFGN